MKWDRLHLQDCLSLFSTTSLETQTITNGLITEENKFCVYTTNGKITQKLLILKFLFSVPLLFVLLDFMYGLIHDYWFQSHFL